MTKKVEPKAEKKDENKEVTKQIEELNNIVNELTKNNNELSAINNKLQEDNANLIEKVKVAQAETINYRKRKDEEVANMLKYANEDLIKELIDLTDNFERAIKLDDNDLTDELSKFLSGFKIMYANLTLILQKYGVEEISRVGEIFDPNLEEALLTDSVEGKANEEVLEVLLKGYKLKDKVIRPASVKVNIEK
jgi:molecular chaperone GrpE